MKTTSRVAAAVKSLKVKPMGKLAKRAMRQRIMDLNQTYRLNASREACLASNREAADKAAELQRRRAELARRVDAGAVSLAYRGGFIDAGALSDDEVELLLSQGRMPTPAETMATMTPEQLAQLEREYAPQAPTPPVAE